MTHAKIEIGRKIILVEPRVLNREMSRDPIDFRIHFYWEADFTRNVATQYNTPIRLGNFTEICYIYNHFDERYDLRKISTFEIEIPKRNIIVLLCSVIQIACVHTTYGHVDYS